MICGHARCGGIYPQEALHKHRELVADVDHQTHISRVARNQIEKRTRYEVFVETKRRQCFDDVVACITIGNERNNWDDYFKEFGSICAPHSCGCHIDSRFRILINGLISLRLCTKLLK